MRIAIVTTSWPAFDGDPSGHFVKAEADALTRRGEDVVVVQPGDNDAFGWPGLAARVRESPRRIGPAAGFVARAAYAVGSERWDRVIAHWAVPSALPVAFAAFAPRAPLEVVSHGGDVRLLAALPGPVRARAVSAIARRAERWRFVSRALLESLVERLPAAAARDVTRVAVVEACAIDVTAPGAAAIAAKKAEVGAPFAVCVARLVPSKRVGAAIAWAAAEGRTLVIVGDGPERAELERAAARVTGRARVRFAGRTTRGEALAWIAAADVVVQASRAEGASTVEREAAALGTPVTQL